MKTNLLKLAIFSLILAGSVCACTEKNEPVEVPFTEYSLTGTSAQWTNLNYDGKVIIINSKEALEGYIECTGGSNYPEIDFSKYTLLLASGTTPNGISSMSKSLQQFSTRYVLNVKLSLNDEVITQQWCTAFITSKLNDKNSIELDEVFSQLAIVRNSDACGYLIHMWTGNLGHYHDMIYTPDVLSDEYRSDGLKVTVVYRFLDKTYSCNNGGIRKVINVISIERI